MRYGITYLMSISSQFGDRKALLNRVSSAVASTRTFSFFCV